MSTKLILISLIILLIGAYAQEAANTTSNTTATPAESEEAKVQEKFDRFCRKWKKTYATPEEKAKRFHIFRHNLKLAEEMAKTGHSAYGITKFFDMEYSDFEKQYGGLEVNFVDMMRSEVQFEDYSEGAMEKIVEQNTQMGQSQNTTEQSTNSTQEGLRHLDEDFVYTSDEDFESDDPKDDPNFDKPDPFGYTTIVVPTTEEPSNLRKTAPKHWDWRAKGAVTYVRNQGVCGACWAFTTVANIEGLYYNQNKELKILSEQELLDCNTNNSGCSGGTLPLAFNYVKNAKGISLRSRYPYVGSQKQCNSTPQEKFGTIKGYVSPGMDEEAIKNMLYSKGPLSAAINSRPLYFYRGGVYDPSTTECNPYGVNH